MKELELKKNKEKNPQQTIQDSFKSKSYLSQNSSRTTLLKK